MNIVFGTIKKAVKDVTSNEKYPGKAVVTVEGIRGENKSRRILFNSTSMELLDIPEGAQQNLIFGFVEADENGNRRVLVANADALPGKEDTVVYNVSKNKVPFENTKEKGKAVSGARIHKEVNSFLEVDQEMEHEYELVFFGEHSGLKLYEFKKINLHIDGKSLNDLIENPLSYNGYNQKDLQDACLDIEDFPVKENIDLGDPLEEEEKSVSNFHNQVITDDFISEV